MSANTTTPTKSSSSPKAANKPFLVHQEYRNKQKELHEAWLERTREREAKIARGEAVGPEEPDPTASRTTDVGLVDLLRFFVIALAVAALAGKFFVGSWVWEYEGRWVQMKTYWPANQRLFSESALAQYDGSDPSKPLYIAIDGDVYDVSSNRRVYGPGGSYGILAGAEGGRSFGTGCFQTHRTHDLRGLTEAELRGVRHWKKFFAEHKSYFKVGRVSHPPIDPASPIPEHCEPEKREAAAAAAAAAQKPAPKVGDPDKKRQEL